MERVAFFTPVNFGGDQPKSSTESLIESVENYFYLGGKKAYVIPGEINQNSKGVVLLQDSPALLAVVLKVISYLTVIIPVVMLIAKAIVRSLYHFHIIDAKQKLEEGIDISQATMEKLQRLMPIIQSRGKDPEITWHQSSNLVFSLASAPNLIFKTAVPNRHIICGGRSLSAEQISEERFANMVKAYGVCLAHRLGLLVIPHAKKLNITGMTVIAEERVNINPNESAQEDLYRLPGLNNTIRQLVTFISKTGFSDVEWRNMPLIDAAPELQGDRCVALVDLEEMEDAATGIFGGLRRGLIRCLHSEEQIDIALARAKQYGIRSPFTTPEEVKARRMEEIRSDQQLQQFYARNGILENARKPIQVADLATLGLNLEEQGDLRIREIRHNGTNGERQIEFRRQPVTLREAVIDVIAQINEAINDTPENASIKGKRSILLNTHDGRLQDYDRLGLPENQWCVTEEQENQIWLRKIIHALVAKGHLFKLKTSNGYGYFIQA